MALFATVASGNPAILKRVVFIASPSDCGKSSIIHALTSMFGGYMYGHSMEKLNEPPTSKPCPEKLVAGKSRLLMVTEAMSPLDVHCVAAVKAITGGDAGQRQRQLYSSVLVETCNHAQLWVVSNKKFGELVVENKRTESVARRLINIPMFTKLKAAADRTDALDLTADGCVKDKFLASYASSYLFFRHVWPWVKRSSDDIKKACKVASFEFGFSNGGSNRVLHRLLDKCLISGSDRSCNSHDIFAVIDATVQNNELPRATLNALANITEEQCAKMLQNKSPQCGSRNAART